MALSNTVILLSQKAFNANTPTITGDSMPAAGYYASCTKSQTISWVLINVVAKIEIQASLCENPVDDCTANEWATIHTIDATLDTLTNLGLTENSFVNLSGNFVKIRAIVSDFTQGTIQNVKATY
jgi:hypothetical protein